MNDSGLLRHFTAERSESAFTELVRLNIDMVYSAAIRQVHDPAAAEDVTQRVFIALAQKAGTIQSHEALAGWLLTTTHYLSIDTLRAQARRRRHEHEAAAMKPEAQIPADEAWDSIYPTLDQMVERLKPSERHAVALRYFRNLSLTDVAAVLGISSAAAQKRVHRGVSRLRKFFAGHGVVTSADALGLVLSTCATAAAPANLVGKIAHTALSASPTAFSATPKVAWQIMAASKMKLLVAAAIVIVSAPAIFLALPGTSPSTSQAIAAPPRDGTGPAKSEAAFGRVYSLKPGEVIKHIPPPFIPERLDYCNSMLGDTFVATASTRPANSSPLPPIPPASSVSIVFWWDKEQLRLKGLNLGDQDLVELIHEIGLFSQETDIPREQLIRKLPPGDWIIRKEATTEQKTAALPPALLGKGMTLKLQPTEREAIVVRGQLQPQQWKRPDSVMMEVSMLQIYLFRGNQRPNSHAVAQTQTELLQTVGEMLGRPVVIEAQLGKAQPVLIHSLGDYWRAVDATDADTADALLKIVSEQTSLRFSRERRTIPTWRLVKADN